MQTVVRIIASITEFCNSVFSAGQERREIQRGETEAGEMIGPESPASMIGFAGATDFRDYLAPIEIGSRADGFGERQLAEMLETVIVGLLLSRATEFCRPPQSPDDEGGTGRKESMSRSEIGAASGSREANVESKSKKGVGESSASSVVQEAPIGEKSTTKTEFGEIFAGREVNVAVAVEAAIESTLGEVIQDVLEAEIEESEKTPSARKGKMPSRELEVGESSGSSLGNVDVLVAEAQQAIVSSPRRGVRVVESVRLVTSWCNPFAHRVAISLRQKGVRHEAIEENILNKNSRTLNANPANKRIPILVHNGRTISDSRIIMEYIDEAWPESLSPLLPTDPFERSAARFWAEYIDIKITRMMLRHINMNSKEVYGSIYEAMIGLNKAMTVISHGESYFLGGTLGFVDIVFAPTIPWIQALNRLDKFKIPDSRQCPRLHEWLSAVQRHPSVKPALEICTPVKLRAFIVNHLRGGKR